MESVEPPEDDVTPDEDDWRSDEEDEDDEDELSDVEELEELDESVEEADGEGDDELVVVPVLLAVVSASASDCNVPTRANTPAAAASVTAAVAAAMRRLPLRTAVAAPRSLTVMTVPLRSDALSRTTVGDQPERSL
ncbi:MULTISPECIES: hypothetical protein [unclassified Streptomyces]|uniref:hypothetical protein n=1 Tax=unclassified Streptomyces TaxID=2593676 RepID=UPI00190C67DC|nr:MULTISPECIES: hypothetical protein [unclassified Streptomyces]MBK3568941.1 hypothetical protein [Streptomyces sp. MBT62]MBK6014597.1 hypothetical protein [Streptomyces sp. MBT53]